MSYQLQHPRRILLYFKSSTVTCNSSCTIPRVFHAVRLSSITKLSLGRLMFSLKFSLKTRAHFRSPRGSLHGAHETTDFQSYRNLFISYWTRTFPIKNFRKFSQTDFRNKNYDLIIYYSIFSHETYDFQS